MQEPKEELPFTAEELTASIDQVKNKTFLNYQLTMVAYLPWMVYWWTLSHLQAWPQWETIVLSVLVAEVFNIITFKLIERWMNKLFVWFFLINVAAPFLMYWGTSAIFNTFYVHNFYGFTLIEVLFTAPLWWNAINGPVGSRMLNVLILMRLIIILSPNTNTTGNKRASLAFILFLPVIPVFGYFGLNYIFHTLSEEHVILFWLMYAVLFYQYGIMFLSSIATRFVGTRITES